jgi:hypothetical protein
MDARVAGARTVRHFDTTDEAIEVLRANLGPGDVLLVVPVSWRFCGSCLQ